MKHTRSLVNTAFLKSFVIGVVVALGSISTIVRADELSELNRC